MSAFTLWYSVGEPRRFFLVPDGTSPGAGDLAIRDWLNNEQSVSAEFVAPFEVTEEQARRWAKDQLGESLDELKGAIDAKLADWRRQLAESKKRPVAEGSTVTPDGLTAILEFFKQLPRVVGQSLSSDDDRVGSARAAMADLQQRLQEGGVEVDDRVKEFPDRLAGLRRDAKSAGDARATKPAPEPDRKTGSEPD